MAVTVTFAPSSCVPPPLTLPPADGSALVVRVQVRMKCAVTERSSLIVTVQVGVVLVQPTQRSKR